jgi:hypothetical protein
LNNIDNWSFVTDADYERTESQVRNLVENKEMVEAIEAKLRQKAEEEENWVRP